MKDILNERESERVGRGEGMKEHAYYMPLSGQVLYPNTAD
jgi:hypothetical protein